MKKPFLAAAVFLLVCANLVWGQSAADVERLLDSKAISCADAAWFVLAAVRENPPQTPEAAFAFARESGWLTKKAKSGAPLSWGGLSLLVMRAFDLEGGLMYRLFAGTRYAYREMASRGFVEGRPYPHLAVSGEEFFRVLEQVISHNAGDAGSAGNAGSVPRDFGFIVRQKANFGDGEKSYGDAGYLGTLIPWFAVPLGANADLYFSGGISAEYDDESWKPIPEIYRAEFSYNPFPYLRLSAGRLPFNDCLSYTMSGLFDGFMAKYNSEIGRLEAGVFYTGLLYKNSAYILLSPGDYADYQDTDGYFASRRLAAALNWEYTGIFNSMNNLSVSGIFQFDLNGADDYIHSQYLAAKLGVPLNGFVNTEYGLVAELAEMNGDAFAAFAASAEIQLLLPTAVHDRLSIAGYFASGSWNDAVGAFTPVTAQGQGKVLRPVLSGISLLQADYAVRLLPALSADFFTAYYFRTDTASYFETGLDPTSKSPLVGWELYGALTWLPVSDISLFAGGGVFLPKTGKAFTDDAPVTYRIELAVNVSF